MSKKFSTLMASFLLASAFSTTAWAETSAFAPKAGEFALLKLGDTNYMTVSEGELKLEAQVEAGAPELSGTETAAEIAAEWKKVFAGVNSQIWKAVKVSKTAASENTYQFVNKQTGEYLAVKLKTDQEDYTTNNVVLNAAGNKDWSVTSSGVIYTIKGDSIFYLDEKTVGESTVLSLKSVSTVNGLPTTSAPKALSFTQILGEGATPIELDLNAAGFNVLMGLTGNDGKLHFNGGKDVTSTQKNALTGVKWTAIDVPVPAAAEALEDNDSGSGEEEASAPAIYLWNGKTTKGYNAPLEKKDFAKKQFLQVDTTYLDKAGKQYFALKTDTLNLDQYTDDGELVWEEADEKPASTHPNELGQFTATYFFGNDSIALAATYLPEATDGEFNQWDGESCEVGVGEAGFYPIVLRSLADVTVLTLQEDDEATGFINPLVQPYATAGGDATDIKTAATVYNLKIKNTDKAYTPLRAVSYANKYLVAVDDENTDVVADVDASNVFAQWALLPGEAGSYSIVNRATELVYYAGPVSVVKDANGKAVKNTYTLGTDTLELAAVELNADNVYEETVDKKKVKYDYSGTFYAGTGDMAYKSFEINPVSAFMSSLAVQFDKDSVMILGDAANAPVWRLENGSFATYGLEIEGIPSLKAQLYKIYTENADGNKYYVYENGDDNVFGVTGDKTAGDPAEFLMVNVLENQYRLLSISENDDEGTVVNKMTINPTPKNPILEVSDANAEKTDLFAISKAEVNKYRTLTAEDGVLGNAKIFMNNETSRYLYENTANIVANNGNKIAKDSLNFLGIFNTAAMTKNAALYVDTAYVDRVDNTRPQYMFAVGVEEFEAHDAIACSYEHNHFDNAGNKVDALHCSHATPATLGYKAGRYLVSLNDSIDGVNNHPGRYDGATRLAFVEAIHRNAEDSLIIKNSKWTDNSKQIVEDEETTYASKDTIKISNDLNVATFALLIKDQADQSFYLETAKDKDGKVQYVRILNGVPVLTNDIEDAAVFNIEATTEEATANEAIAAEGVQVIGGKGAVTVQGAAGKVITVANILGQTIANQVAASDNVTIAAPAGVVVVAVEGEATKVVVK